MIILSKSGEIFSIAEKVFSNSIIQYYFNIMKKSGSSYYIDADKNSLYFWLEKSKICFNNGRARWKKNKKRMVIWHNKKI